MAAILLSACTVSQESIPGFNVYKVVTPATADDADTIDMSSLFGADEVVSARAQGATDGSVVAAVTTAGLFTIPGSTDNEARTCWIIAKSA